MAITKVYISVRISSSSVANPTVLTFPTTHGFQTGDTITIEDHAGSTPSINGTHVVTRLTDLTVSIPVNVTVGGTGGRATAPRAVVMGTVDLAEVVNGKNSLVVNVYSDDAMYRPAEGSRVVMTVDDVPRFAGFVNVAQEFGVADDEWKDIFTRCTCVHLTSLADRFFVDHTFTAGMTLKQILQYLETNHLSNFDVTLDPGQADGFTLDADLQFTGSRGSEVFSQLVSISVAEGTPFYWFFNPDYTFGMAEIGTVFAPDIAQGDDTIVLESPTVERSRRQKANRLWVTLGTAKLVRKEETFITDGITNSFTLKYNIRGHWWFPGLTGAAVAYGVVYPTGYTASITESIGGTTSPMIWHYDDTTKSISRITGGTPGAGTVRIPYDAEFPITFMLEDLVDIAENGLYEDRIAFPDVYDIDIGTKLAEARFGASTDLEKVTFRTLSDGYAPGKVINSFEIPKQAITGSYLVIEVRAHTDIDSNELLWWDVTAVKGDLTRETWQDVYISWLGGGVSTTTGSVEIGGAGMGSMGPAAPDRSVQFNRDFQFGGSDLFLFDYDVGGDTYGVEDLPSSVAIGVADENQMVLSLWNETAGKDKASTFWMFDTTGEVFWESLSHVSIFADGELAFVGNEGIDMDTSFDAWINVAQMVNLQSVSMRIDRKTANFTAPEVTTFRATGFTFIVDTSSGDKTVTLKPFADTEVSPVANRRRVLIFKNIGSNNLILDGDGAETITFGTSSAATLTLGPGHSCMLQAWDGTGATWHVLLYSTGSTAGAPGGSDGQVQYNNGGVFGGDTGLTWDDTLKRLTVENDSGNAGSPLSVIRNGGVISVTPMDTGNLNILMGMTEDAAGDWIAHVANPGYFWHSSPASPPQGGFELIQGQTPGDPATWTQGQGFSMGGDGRFQVYQYGGLGTGAVPGCAVEIQYNEDGDGAAGVLWLYDRLGNPYYLWVEAGELRMGTAGRPTEDDSIPHTGGAAFSSAVPSVATLLTADPGSPADDTWWIKRTGAGPYTISLNVRISGVTYPFNLGST